MKNEKVLKYVHFLSMCFFLLSAGYMLSYILMQKTRNSFFVSLSGLSTLIFGAIVFFYLLAFIKSLTLNNYYKAEHPFTSSIYYMIFYDLSPFIGASGAIIAMSMLKEIDSKMLFISIGTLISSFLVWILLDPLIQVSEMLLPSSLKYKKKRKKHLKAIKKAHKNAQLNVLKEIKESEKELKSQRVFQEMSLKLFEALNDNEPEENEIIDLGLKAWQIGKIQGMQQLFEMTFKNEKDKQIKGKRLSYIWDGIGSWKFH